MSGLGKGVTASSIAKLIKEKGYKVSCLKIDPYVNVDAGTIRPTEHGEVFVTEDGGEIDQDLGNYERFLNKNHRKEHNLTTGKIYQKLINKERKGEYLGKTVQIIPHLIEEIIEHIEKTGEKEDFLVIEIGGTVGDYENIPFLEAARQMRREKSHSEVVFVHVTYLPIISAIGEQKTKPTQHSVKELRSEGIIPDFIIGRSEKPLDEPRKEKISLFCDVKKEKVISAPNVDNIYKIPVKFKEQKLGDKILNQTKLKEKNSDLQNWMSMLEKMDKSKDSEKEVKIGLVGKYISSGDFSVRDSYISVTEAVKHAAGELETNYSIKWIDSTDSEKAKKEIDEMDSVIIPGGFGTSGIKGKIEAIKKCREDKIPFLGLCLGLQLAVIEHARNELSLKKANSTEIDEDTPHPVICLLEEQKEIENKGNTMRLGSYPAILKKNTKTKNLYGEKRINERHRHRYEVNPEYHNELEKNSMVFSGKSPDGKLIEFIERNNHPFFIATQSHPEFKSRPEKPHPLFKGLIEKGIDRAEKRN